MTATAVAPPKPKRLASLADIPANMYVPWGNAKAFFESMEPEVLLSGPSGTGKSRVSLEKIFQCCDMFPGTRALMARKTRRSMTQSTMVTFRTKVLPSKYTVPFHTTDQEYRFPNGSVIVAAGMDDPEKTKSTDYDIIYINEVTELALDDYEILLRALRNGVMPFQQLISDCNPSYPQHWVYQRYLQGILPLVESRHEDNPRLFDPFRREWTREGVEYLAKLDRMTGARKQRLRYGRWVGTEGAVYEEWNAALSVINQIPGTEITRDTIPAEWPRYRTIDFGYTNPFVCQWWAADPDGRLYLYREIYRTQKLVEDMARQITHLSRGERILFTLADHDAEDRATLAAHGITTLAAPKAIPPGIQAVKARMKVQGDGRPRLYMFRDAVVKRDPALIEAGKPTCTIEEVDGYVWAKNMDGSIIKEVPVKEDDHGLDPLRYLCLRLDGTRDKKVRVWA